MIGSSSSARLGWAALAACACLAGCADVPPPPAQPAAAAAPEGADDGDLWNLAPADAESIAEIDVAALGRSPWSNALVTGGFAEDREQRLRELGYDVFGDVERLLLAGVASAVAPEAAASGGPSSLTVARGRFDAAKVSAAFTASVPGVHAGRWRDSPLWESESAGKALALVTPRTLVQGTPAAVRGAIDAAWRVVPDARGGALGEIRRALDADRSPAAVTLVVAVSDDVRARAAGFLEMPPGLRRVGVRLDLGHDLDLEMSAFLDGPRDAQGAADTWRGALREAARQPMLRMLGLAPLVDGASVRAVGSRVQGRLHVGEEHRAELADRLLFLLRTIARGRRAQPSHEPG